MNAVDSNVLLYRLDLAMESEEQEGKQSTLNGWWYVLLLFWPAAWLQLRLLGGGGRHFPDRYDAVVAIDCLIAFRALMGVINGNRSRWWVVYLLLYGFVVLGYHVLVAPIW